MDPQRLERLIDDLDEDRRTGGDIGERLSGACAELLSVSGAGIMLMTAGEHRGTLGTSNEAMRFLEDLQFTLGEGPCIDASASMRPVLEPNLGHPITVRWPSYAGPALDAGARAVFGFPLRSGGTAFGALDLYLDRPSDLRPDQVTDALLLAEVICRTVLSLQADSGADLSGQIDLSFDRRAVVHQAAGILSVRLEVSVADALALVRAHAYAAGRPVDEVAGDIVERRLRLY